MAQRYIGLDPGAWSIKAAVVEVQAGAFSLVEAIEIPLAADAGPDDRAAALRAVTPHAAGTAVSAVLSGAHLSFKTLDFPFRDRRTVERVLAQELADRVPFDLAGMVYDALPVGTHGAQGPYAFSVVMAPRERMAELVAGCEAAALELRDVQAGPYALAGVARFDGGDDPDGLLVFDVGHAATEAVFVRRGEAAFVRSFPAGVLDVYDALGAAELDADALEAAKTALAVPLPATVAGEAATAAVETGLEPLFTQTAYTLQAVVAKFGRGPARIAVAGAGAVVPGLAERLAQQLDVPVDRLRVPAAPHIDADTAVRFAKAVGAVAAGVTRKGVNRLAGPDFRKGDFAGRDDLRRYAGWAGLLGRAAAVVAAFGMLNVMSITYELGAAEAAAKKQMGDITKEILGRSVTNVTQATAMMDEVIQGGGDVSLPVPAVPTVDVMVVAATAMTQPDVGVELTELEIRTNREQSTLTLKGLTASLATVALLEERLKEYECFKEVVPGATQRSAEGDKQKFSFTISVGCPPEPERTQKREKRLAEWRRREQSRAALPPSAPAGGTPGATPPTGPTGGAVGPGAPAVPGNTGIIPPPPPPPGGPPPQSPPMQAMPPVPPPAVPDPSGYPGGAVPGGPTIPGSPPMPMPPPPRPPQR